MQRKEHDMEEEDSNKNRGYFSEKTAKVDRVLEEINLERSTSALVCPMFSWSVQTERYSPVLSVFHTAERKQNLEPALKWIRYPGRVSVAFPVQTVKPKVQLVPDAIPGQLPREVEVDRRRRKYAKLNIQDLLIEARIDNYRLTPIHTLDSIRSVLEKDVSIFNRTCLFPLEWFDNQDFDPMTPQEWLLLGYVDGVRHPIPAEALLPNPFIREKMNLIEVISHTGSPFLANSREQQEYAKIKNHLYTWAKVAVKNYDLVRDKWLVTNLATAKTYKIPRIYLMFTVENPQDFLKRIQYAVNLREKSERKLKFEVIVDCLELSGLPKLKDTSWQKILKLTMSTPKKAGMEWIDDENYQADLQFQRVHAAMEFKNNVLKNPNDYPFLDIPEKHCMIIRPPIETVGKERYKELQQLLKQNTIFYVKQSINAMYKVASACEELDKESLFTFAATKSTILEDFVSTQQYACNTVSKYLKGSWLESMTGQICMRLRGVGKGWLDLNIGDWEVYKVSKMSRFLRQVKFRMQDAIHNFLDRSILGYSKFLCDPCEIIEDFHEKSFEWTFPLNFSPYKPKSSHIFNLTLCLTENGASYSTDPNQFRPTIIELLDDALLECCSVQQVDPNVISSLVFPNDLYLESIVLVEDLIEAHRNKLTKMYDIAILPLKAYARRYDEFIPLHFLVVTDYIKDFFQIERTPGEVKEEINKQIELRDHMKNNIPKTIVIGPFIVSVDLQKQFLVNKRQDIIKKLLDSHANKITKKTEILVEKYKKLMEAISEKPNSIDDVFKIKTISATIPDRVAELNDETRYLLQEYDVLDHFNCLLSNETFGVKWQAIGWGHKILEYLEALNANEEQLIENFRKQQINDRIAYIEGVDALSDEILKFSRMFDPTKALENAAKIKNTWKIVQQLQKETEILQERQIMLGMSALMVDTMAEVTINIERYKNLWFSCADFLKYKEIAYGNNLLNLDVAALKATIFQIQENLQRGMEDFRDISEIKNVAIHYLGLLQSFQSSLAIIEYVRSPHWTLAHWQELVKRAELNMKFTISINFRYCINKRILDHAELIKEIWEKSKYEAEQIAKESAEEEMQKQEAESTVQKKKNRRGRTDI